MSFQHTEVLYKAAGSDTVIVFVHGIQGSPAQFDALIEKLDGAYSVVNLLLPGHGGSIREFAESSMDAWQAYVDEHVRRAQQEYQNVILVGHSMGCLLSVQAALTYPQKIRGLFLTAMPLRVYVRFKTFRNALIVAFHWKSRTEEIEVVRKANSVSAETPLGYLRGTPRYIELYAKIKATRSLVRQLTLPIVVAQSRKDEVVSRKSIRYVRQMENVQVLWAEKAAHTYYPQEARAYLADALVRFIGQVVPEKSEVS
jgi:carboxylesterase